jgi:hypothetical protein
VTRTSISGSFCQSGASRLGSFCQAEPLVGMLGFVLPNRATMQRPSDLVELGSFGQNGMPRSGSFCQNELPK